MTSLRLFTNISSGANLDSAIFYPFGQQTSGQRMGPGNGQGLIHIELDDDPDDVNKDINIRILGTVDEARAVFERLNISKIDKVVAAGTVIHNFIGFFGSNSKHSATVPFTLMPVCKLDVVQVASSTNVINAWVVF